MLENPLIFQQDGVVGINVIYIDIGRAYFLLMAWTLEHYNYFPTTQPTTLDFNYKPAIHVHYWRTLNFLLLLRAYQLTTIIIVLCVLQLHTNQTT